MEKRWENYIGKWTGLEFTKSKRAAENRKMEGTGCEVVSGPQRPRNWSRKDLCTVFYQFLLLIYRCICLLLLLGDHSHQVDYIITVTVSPCFNPFSRVSAALCVSRYCYLCTIVVTCMSMSCVTMVLPESITLTAQETAFASVNQLLVVAAGGLIPRQLVIIRKKGQS